MINVMSFGLGEEGEKENVKKKKKKTRKKLKLNKSKLDLNKIKLVHAHLKDEHGTCVWEMCTQVHGRDGKSTTNIVCTTALSCSSRDC